MWIYAVIGIGMFFASVTIVLSIRLIQRRQKSQYVNAHNFVFGLVTYASYEQRCDSQIVTVFDLIDDQGRVYHLGIFGRNEDINVGVNLEVEPTSKCILDLAVPCRTLYMETAALLVYGYSAAGTVYELKTT